MTWTRVLEAPGPGIPECDLRDDVQRCSLRSAVVRRDTEQKLLFVFGILGGFNYNIPITVLTMIRQLVLKRSFIRNTYSKISVSRRLYSGSSLLRSAFFCRSCSYGNHGESVKEIYFYADNTPTHSYMKYLYKYPQKKFPYEQLRQLESSSPMELHR